jgi:hypothetical protein
MVWIGLLLLLCIIAVIGGFWAFIIFTNDEEDH